MRDQQERSGSLFSYVSIEALIPANHPLRRIRKLADQSVPRSADPHLLRSVCLGRPPIGSTGATVLLASLLQAFYGIRSESLLQDQLHYNLLFRCYGFTGPAVTSA